MTKKKPPQKGSLKHNRADYSTIYEDFNKFNHELTNFGWQSGVVVADTGINRGRTKKDAHLWAVLYSTPVVAGAYGSWRTGESYKFCAKSFDNLTDQEKTALKQKYKTEKLKRQQETIRARKLAQKKAAYIVTNAVHAPDSFEYLKNKKVQAHGALLYQNALVIPLCDVHGVLHSVQFILADASKRFQKGARTKAVFHGFGRINPNGELFITEGWATAATVYEWKRKPTLAALNAGNLLPVALEIKKKYPNISLCFAADNDRFNKLGNIGLEKAEHAARVIGGGATVLLPQFTNDSSGTDWNDLWVENGGKLP